ncbi:hypothetical protein ACIOKD_14470 [Streptomyces sp. NPDC087844]|uniref:hypothetical protein n=1 Tax=Streptomyces sp. NPDC087844 TaxID=3365805 RepID=UPI0038300E53
MTAQATKRRRAPAKAPKVPNPRTAQGSSPEAEFRRWTPDEVAALKLLPYTERMIREKCYRRELHFHKDGGRITFTAEDLRLNNQLGAQAPAA